MALYRLCVADVMTLDPIVVRMDAPIEDAQALIESNHVSGLPVVDDAGALVGVVSQTDLVRLAHPSVARQPPPWPTSRPPPIPGTPAPAAPP